MSNSSRKAPVSATLALPLGGCADGLETLAAVTIGLTGIFVALLFVVPPIQNYLGRREHLRRMRDRPWLKDAKRSGRRKS